MERTYEHVMGDLETLGTTPGCTILSIGLCPFDVKGIAPESDRLHLIISRADSEVCGLFEDPTTLAWWGEQSWEAQETLRQATEGGTTLTSSLFRVSEYLEACGGIDVKGYPKVCFWGNGSDFDNTILAAAYRSVSLFAPWPFWKNRCFRTLKSLPGVHHLEPRREGTLHNALDDAVHQARWAVAILRDIEVPGDCDRAR